MQGITLNSNTAISELVVNKLPLTDDTDFKTLETAIAYNAAGMSLTWHFVTTAGVYTQTAVTPSNTGNYLWTNKGNGFYAIQVPASGGASINNNAAGFGWFSLSVTGVLPVVSPLYCFRPSALNTAMIAGTTELAVNAASLGGTSVSSGATGPVDVLGIVDRGTLQSATSSTAVIRAAASFADDFLNGKTIHIVSGTGTGQTRFIADYVGSTDTATISPNWVTIPDNTSVYEIFATAPASSDTIYTASGLRSALGMSAADLDTQLDAIGSAVVDGFAAVTAVTDKLDTMVELDTSVYRFTVNALEQAPAGGGGGGTDWTADERTAIRAILGIPASGSTPSTPSVGILAALAGYVDTVESSLTTITAYVDGVESALSTAQTAISDIQSRLPVSLSGGRMVAAVESIAANAITASAVAADAVTEIQTGLATASGLTSAVSGLNDLNSTEIETAVSSALTAFGVPTVTQMNARTLASASYATATDADEILLAIAGISTGGGLTEAQVKAQVVEALNTDTYSEITSVPVGAATIQQMINFIYALSKNKLVQTASTVSVRNSADNANIASGSVSDVGGTFTRGALS